MAANTESNIKAVFGGSGENIDITQPMPNPLKAPLITFVLSPAFPH